MMVAAVFISSLMNGVVAAASDASTASTEDEYVSPTFMAVSFSSTTNMKHNAWHALCIPLFDDDVSL